MVTIDAVEAQIPDAIDSGDAPNNHVFLNEAMVVWEE
jgi:hypothetical protein